MKKLLYILLFVPLALFGQDYTSLIDDLTIRVDLDAGWNMIGYTCQYEKDAEEAFSLIAEELLILKDNDGSVYWPEYGFNGIGNLTPGLGYQIKIDNPVYNFSLNNSCFFGCTSTWAENYNPEAGLDDGSCYLYGCTSSWAENYNPIATINDGYCYLNACTSSWADNYNTNATNNDGSCYRYGCTSPLAINFDQYATDDNGGCLSMASLFTAGTTTGANMTAGFSSPIFDQFEGGQIGAFSDLDGDGTLECVGLETIGPINGFFGIGIWGDDSSTSEVDGLGPGWVPQLWAILHEGNVIVVNDVYQFTGYVTNGIVIITDVSLSMNVECTDPSADNYTEVTYTGVEIIDADMCVYGGCMDETACNYNIGENICIYAEEGYDCEGNMLPQYQVGDITEGGMVFYIDESGEHGLVSALQNIDGFYQWGCYGDTLDGADGIVLGTGYQNTMDIVNQGCATDNGGVTAAQAALDYEFAGYSDWYLPSGNELNLMYHSIGYGADNQGGFSYSEYWSSSKGTYNNTAFRVSFVTSQYQQYPRHYSELVRPIRSF